MLILIHQILREPTFGVVRKCVALLVRHVIRVGLRRPL
jgi:hypothetical protein